METSIKQADVVLCSEARSRLSSAHFRKAPFLTVELKRRWQMLQEMICFFLRGWGTPNVWLITAFWTGSIWETARHIKAALAFQDWFDWTLSRVILQLNSLQKKKKNPKKQSSNISEMFHQHVGQPLFGVKE